MDIKELPQPHGNVTNLHVDSENVDQLKDESRGLPKWLLTSKQFCDLELILNKGFAPLSGFMNSTDYNSVCSSMRLSNGILWPLPITLDVTNEFAQTVSKGTRVALCDGNGLSLAIITVDDIWTPNNIEEAELVFGTSDIYHAGVALLRKSNPVRIGGQLDFIQLPEHAMFSDLHLTPLQLRRYFKYNGINSVIAFQTRNPMHIAHVELTKQAIKQTGAHLLIHPAVGITKPGDTASNVRVECYKALLNRYKKGSVSLSLLPVAMRMAGPREAIWHAIIRQNYGCNYFIVGRDHAGPGNDANGNPYYQPYAAHELLMNYITELEIKPLFFEEMVYVKDTNSYMPRSKVASNHKFLSLSGSELRSRLARREPIPEWFSYPEVVDQLRKLY